MQTFTPTYIKYLYSPAHAPIGSVAAGERFTIDTEDCFTAKFRNAADWNPASAAWVDDNLNGVTGPLRVQGATAGGAVEVSIESIDVTTPGCVVVSRCRSLSPSDWWHEEDHAVNLDIIDGRLVIEEGWSVPVRPLIGCLATAPAKEAVLSRHEGDYGGNLDCREITAGATVVLPVEVDGAHLYFGDCKAAMGAGEVTCAPEVGTRIVARATPVPRPASMGCPRVRTASSLTTIVSAPSLSDAARSAFRQLKLWIEEDWGLDSDRAAIVMGMAADCGIGQVSNLLHTATCTIDLAVLPPRP